MSVFNLKQSWLNSHFIYLVESSVISWRLSFISVFWHFYIFALIVFFCWQDIQYSLKDYYYFKRIIESGETHFYKLVKSSSWVLFNICTYLVARSERISFVVDLLICFYTETESGRKKSFFHTGHINLCSYSDYCMFVLLFTCTCWIIWEYSVWHQTVCSCHAK